MDLPNLGIFKGQDCRFKLYQILIKILYQKSKKFYLMLYILQNLNIDQQAQIIILNRHKF